MLRCSKHKIISFPMSGNHNSVQKLTSFPYIRNLCSDFLLCLKINLKVVHYYKEKPSTWFVDGALV